MNETIVSLFVRRVRDSGPKTALLTKRDGAFVPVTWDAFALDVARAAATLIRLGVQPGDRVVQVSENRYEWLVTDLAIQIAQAVHVPVHATLTGEQISFQIDHSGAKLVLVSTPEQAGKLATNAFTYSDSWPREVSQTPVDDPHRLFNAAVSAVMPDSLATILYTSGTTGEPKGVMLSQRNLASNAQAVSQVIVAEPDDLRLSFLPLSHIFARTCDVYTWLVIGQPLALAESRETVVADCQAVRPTLLNGVPYFYDKLRRVLVDNGRAGEPGVLRGMLGGRIRVCCSGGAALPDYVYEFFRTQGVTLVQGYGLTESSPTITIAPPAVMRAGIVGPPIPGVEVRIADDGEVLTRGPHVMLGYWRNPDATAEVLRDGWLATGDLGEITADGALRITGRKKEILVTAAGKNIAPVYLEGLLTADPLIAQALVVGDGRNYLAALLVPNLDVVRSALPTECGSLSTAELLGDERVRTLFESRLQSLLAGVSPHEQVRRFALLPQPFTIEAGEMTAKLSLRRGVIERHYAAEIAALYAQR